MKFNGMGDLQLTRSYFKKFRYVHMALQSQMIILGFRKLGRIREFPQGRISCRSYCTTNNLLEFTIVENNKH